MKLLSETQHSNKWESKAEMYTQKERVGASPLVRKRAAKEQLNHLYRTVRSGLCLPLANYLVFSSPDLPWDPPQHACTTFSKMDSSPEAYGITY